MASITSNTTWPNIFGHCKAPVPARFSLTLYFSFVYFANSFALEQEKLQQIHKTLVEGKNFSVSDDNVEETSPLK